MVQQLTRFSGRLSTSVSISSARTGGTDHAGPLRMRGQAASAGRYVGRACVVRTPSDLENVEAGDVLVALIAAAECAITVPLVGALVVARAGVLSSAATLARECGIPAVVGAGAALGSILDGAQVAVDGDRGLVEVVTRQ